MKGLLLKICRFLGIEHSLSEGWLFLQYLVCVNRYRKCCLRAKRKPKAEKIRVLFIVSEIAKWKEQALYDAMESSDDFYPIVGLSAWNLQRNLPPEELDAVHARAEAFFDRLGHRHVRTVTTEKGRLVYHDLSDFKPDIVFYTEQWGPCPKQRPSSVSRFALTFFLPYYVPDFGIIGFDCLQPVTRLAYVYFCLNEDWAVYYRDNMKKVRHCAQYVATGHPSLDLTCGGTAGSGTEKYVIYAPHFSYFDPARPNDCYIIGTFDWSGRAILEYAEAHPEVKWVFKPHPILRKRLVEVGTMTSDEADDYYRRWAKIAVVSTDANYRDLFVNSRVMITDSASFLPEYGSMGKPVIRLISKYFKHVPPRAAANLYDSYYQVHDIPEMREVFLTVIEKGLDPNRETRLRLVREAGLGESNASQNIMRYARSLFNR